MKEIQLTKGQVALVDDDIYEELNKYNWYAIYIKKRDCYYAARKKKTDPSSKWCETILMHRFIKGLKKGDHQQIDHINQKTLDNRSDNLRVCTYSQNNMNRKSPGNSHSKYRGIRFAHGKWYARIKYKGKEKHLGCFEKEEDAANAYLKAANDAFGEYAYHNSVGATNG